MKAILQKTVNKSFKAGDVIVAENYRIKRLNEKGIATPDHSLLAMAGNIFSIIFAGLLMAVIIVSYLPTPTHYTSWVHFDFWWALTLIIVSAITILFNIAFFINAQIPYITYYMSFNMNILGGIMIMAGHERARHKYQPVTSSSLAAVLLYTIGALVMIFGLWGNVYTSVSYHNNETSFVVSFVTWLIYIILIIVGVVIAIVFDIDFQRRRRRYIAFLQRKNVMVEYKTKALNAYRAYQKTGNSDEFMKQNILFLEESLNVDRAQIVDPKNKNDKK